MENLLKLVVDLQLFAEGAGTGAGDGSDGQDNNQQGTPEPQLTHKHGRRQNPLADVKYGVQPEAAEQPAAEEEASQDDADTGAEPTREEWEAMKKGKFAKFYGEDVSSTVKDRLKNSKQSEEQMRKLAPVLEGLSKKYGKDVTDIDGLIAAYNDDDSLYEEEAMEKGLSVSTLKSIKQLERANAQMKAQQEADAQQMLFDQHIAKLAA